MPRLNIPDPRPSKAHPEQRKIRKELEKEHGYGWVPPLVLGLIGLTLAYDVTKDVEKHEEKHRKDDEEAEQRRRRRRDREARYGSPHYRRRSSYDGADGGSDAYAYDDRDAGGYGGRRDRSEVPRQWDFPEDEYAYEPPSMERAESLERGEAYDAKFDGGLDRADQLEKGEGGVDDWDRYEDRSRPGITYQPFEEGRRYRRRQDDDLDYEYVDYTRGRRDLASSRSRPRPRRRSSDW